MGKNLAIIPSLVRTAVSLSIIAFFAIRCGDESKTVHYKYIGAAEWSPISMNAILIAKDEFDASQSTGSGCNSSQPVASEPTSIAYELFLTDTSGRVLKQLTHNMRLPNQMKYKWSPRGDKILFWGATGYPLRLIDTAGRAIRLDSVSYTSDADWSPDGSMIVCSSAKEGGLIPRLTVLTENGAFVRRLLDTVQTGAVSWSSTNRIAFAYQQNNGSIYLATIQPDGGSLHREDSTGIVFHLDWLPDGSTLLYSVEDGANSLLYSLVPVTHERTTLALFQDNTKILSARYSPDGSRISYYTYLTSTQFDLYVINTDGSNGQRIASLSTDGSWSPDSRHMVYVYYNAVYTKNVQ